MHTFILNFVQYNKCFLRHQEPALHGSSFLNIPGSAQTAMLQQTDAPAHIFELLLPIPKLFLHISVFVSMESHFSVFITGWAGWTTETYLLTVLEAGGHGQDDSKFGLLEGGFLIYKHMPCYVLK